MGTTFVLESVPTTGDENTITVGLHAEGAYNFAMSAGGVGLDEDGITIGNRMYLLAGTWPDLPAGVIRDMAEERCVVTFEDSNVIVQTDRSPSPFFPVEEPQVCPVCFGRGYTSKLDKQPKVGDEWTHIDVRCSRCEGTGLVGCSDG